MKNNDEKQFGDYDCDMMDLNFKAGGFTKKVAKSIQTEQITFEDKEIMAKKTVRTVKMQVESEQIKKEYINQQQQPQEQTEEQKAEIEQQLQIFLNKTSPLMMQALKEHIMSLDTYEPLWSDERKENQTLFIFKNSANRAYEIEKQLEVTDISWNCTGMILAAAYGRFEHEGACQDKSFVCAWNSNKRDFNPEKPTQTIETQFCIMSVEFHPTRQYWLVGGSFNGEIILWDISKEDDNILGQSSIDEYFHRESITQLMWFDYKVQGAISTQYNLLSLSTDGKVLLWDMKYDEAQKMPLLTEPIKGYSLLRKKEGQISSVGGLCFAQNPEDKNTFVICSEAGSVLRALITNQGADKKDLVLLEQADSKFKWKPSTYPFMSNVANKYLPEIKITVEKYCEKKGVYEIGNADIFNSKPDIRKLYGNNVSFAYEPHIGPVYSVNFSPFLRNIFVTGSLDGQIRIYDLLQVKSLLCFDNFHSYVFKTEWSQTRPGLLCAALQNGDVIFYDLFSQNKGAQTTLKSEDLGEGIAALNIRFNKIKSDIIAIAYQGCQIKVLQLCDDLSTIKKDELNILNQMMEEYRTGQQ